MMELHNEGLKMARSYFGAARKMVLEGQQLAPMAFGLRPQDKVILQMSLVDMSEDHRGIPYEDFARTTAKTCR